MYVSGSFVLGVGEAIGVFFWPYIVLWIPRGIHMICHNKFYGPFPIYAYRFIHLVISCIFCILYMIGAKFENIYHFASYLITFLVVFVFYIFRYIVVKSPSHNESSTFDNSNYTSPGSHLKTQGQKSIIELMEVADAFYSAATKLLRSEVKPKDISILEHYSAILAMYSALIVHKYEIKTTIASSLIDFVGSTYCINKKMNQEMTDVFVEKFNFCLSYYTGAITKESEPIYSEYVHKCILLFQLFIAKKNRANMPIGCEDLSLYEQLLLLNVVNLMSIVSYEE